MQIIEFVNIVVTCDTNTIGLLLPITLKYNELVDMINSDLNLHSSVQMLKIYYEVGEILHQLGIQMTNHYTST